MEVLLLDVVCVPIKPLNIIVSNKIVRIFMKAGLQLVIALLSILFTYKRLLSIFKPIKLTRNYRCNFSILFMHTLFMCQL